MSLRPSVEIPLKIGDFLDLQTFIFISVENIWKMALKNGVGKIGEWYCGNIVQDYWKTIKNGIISSNLYCPKERLKNGIRMLDKFVFNAILYLFQHLF